VLRSVIDLPLPGGTADLRQLQQRRRNSTKPLSSILSGFWPASTETQAGISAEDFAAYLSRRGNKEDAMPLASKREATVRAQQEGQETLARIQATRAEKAEKRGAVAAWVLDLVKPPPKGAPAR
jgi:hypothetical protein